MNKVRDAFCSFCGTAHTSTTYPRTCPSCATTIWANPIPVAVALVPVQVKARRGLLVVRRGMGSARGTLALVGGFLEEHESWQDGAARECREETGVIIDAKKLEPFWYASSEPRPNRVLLFAVAPTLDTLPPHVANAETAERGVVFGLEGLD